MKDISCVVINGYIFDFPRACCYHCCTREIVLCLDACVAALTAPGSRTSVRWSVVVEG